MKRYLIYILASAALMATGCSKENAGEKGLGSVRFVCETDGEITIASQSRATNVPAPAPADFKLSIKGGENYDKTWETLAAYNTEDPLIPEGNYTASASFGAPDTEGPGKPYFFGEANFMAQARKTSHVEITASLLKSLAVVRATPQFLSYFHDIKFTLTTGSGNKFDFNLDAEGYAEVPIYVLAGKTLSVEGTAHRQSQTGEDNGLKVKFDAVKVDAAALRKSHIFTFDAANAGSANLTIVIGDYDEVLEFPFELNDDAIL